MRPSRGIEPNSDELIISSSRHLQLSSARVDTEDPFGAKDGDFVESFYQSKNAHWASQGFGITPPKFASNAEPRGVKG